MSAAVLIRKPSSHRGNDALERLLGYRPQSYRAKGDYILDSELPWLGGSKLFSLWFVKTFLASRLVQISKHLEDGTWFPQVAVLLPVVYGNYKEAR